MIPEFKPKVFEYDLPDGLGKAYLKYMSQNDHEKASEALDLKNGARTFVEFKKATVAYSWCDESGVLLAKSPKELDNTPYIVIDFLYEKAGEINPLSEQAVQKKESN